MPEPSGTGTLQSRGLNPLPATTTALTLLLQLLSMASGGSPDLLMEAEED